MLQIWDAISLDSRQRYRPLNLNFAFFFEAHETKSLVYLFARHDVKLLATAELQAFAEARKQLPLTILKLPTETLAQIFEELDNVSLIRLTLACKPLLMIGASQLERRIQQGMSPWAGSRFILSGDYCLRYDLPKGLLTKDEEEMLDIGFLESEPSDEELRQSKEEGIPMGPVKLSIIAEVRFEEISNPGKFQDLSGFLSKHERSRLTSAETDFLKHLISHSRSMYTQSTETWVLRNLTAEEFVCGDYLFKAFQGSVCPAGPDIGYPGFGEAIFSRVCWTNMPLEIPTSAMCEGPWAGHRFEICFQSDHTLHSDATWKDVSNEVAAEIRLILDAIERKKIR